MDKVVTILAPDEHTYTVQWQVNSQLSRVSSTGMLPSHSSLSSLILTLVDFQLRVPHQVWNSFCFEIRAYQPHFDVHVARAAILDTISSSGEKVSSSPRNISRFSTVRQHDALVGNGSSRESQAPEIFAAVINSTPWTQYDTSPPLSNSVGACSLLHLSFSVKQKKKICM
jgi:hypothetical protein